jgi:GNAT superfamily N-acetyltransferase
MVEPVPEMVIRQAGTGDVRAVAVLRSLWSTGADISPGFEQRMGDWLASEGDRRTIWIAWNDEVAVGMASMLEYRRMPHPGRPDSRWGYISNMFVRAELRRRGIGSALLGELIAAGRERRYARLVLSPSEEAISFYQRAGFVSPEQTAGVARLLVRLGEP